jgi:hypothetical protein
MITKMTSYRMHRLTMIAGHSKDGGAPMDRRAGVLLFNYQGTTPTWYNEEENEGQRGIVNNQLEYGREGTLCNNQLERREK